jgi:ribonucleotide monophosphatase NagD (HAD superfamily)
MNKIISHFYMIGDNPPVDIKGANDSGWQSILVRTGVFQGQENDLENPAKYVVESVKEAVELIHNLEKF